MWLGPPTIDGAERDREPLSLLSASSDGKTGAPSEFTSTWPRNVGVPSGAIANREIPPIPEPIVAGELFDSVFEANAQRPSFVTTTQQVASPKLGALPVGVRAPVFDTLYDSTEPLNCDGSPTSGGVPEGVSTP